jgi:RNA 3'-terminal phosphate cyclase (ATP)
MLTLDGSFGEGGGQILRTSLALSLVTRTPFRIDRVRARRARPGLMRQHLTAVEAAAAIGRARVTGAQVGSQTLEFHPGDAAGGEYRFSVGTSGSATLVFQTVLPALLGAAAPSTLVLEGGTHNPLAPTFDFLARAFLPLLGRMGARVTASLERPGFHPAGGGRFTAAIDPTAKLSRLDLLERGEIRRRRATAMVAALPVDIARRELDTVRRRLGWDPDWCLPVEITSSAGPGNVVQIEIESEHVTELFSGFGKRGVRAELVAERVAAEAEAYLAAGVPVGAHLADQLLLPLALAGGGSFRTLDLTPHTSTQIEVIRRFIARTITCEQIAPGTWQVEVA